MATYIKRPLSNLMNKEALEFALYNIEQRSIPSLIDGFKPVHRFVMHSALTSAAHTRKKVASICGIVSDLGYHHGETSASDAACLLAAEWYNNYVYLDGEGTFGSRMIQDPAQPRYVFAKVHKNFYSFFRDLDIHVEHKDPENKPPLYYVPVVPVVLLNGVMGIATGFASTILPHKLQWVVECTEQMVKTGNITLEERNCLQFPEYYGEIIKDEQKSGRYIQYGKFEITGYTVEITDIPTSYTHEDYIKVLESKLDNKQIVSYEDLTRENFHFKVKMKRNVKMTHDNIADILKLKISKPYNQNINVINEHGFLQHYDTAIDLVKDFVKFRLNFLIKRIQKGIDDCNNKIEYLSVRSEFINQVNSNTIKIQGIKKKELVKYIEDNITKKYASELSSIRIDKFTQDEIESLNNEIDQYKKQLNYWNSTNPKKEFLKDLKQLRKELL